VLASAFHRYGPPDVLELVELPDLTAQAGQVRVRVEAATVNPADTLFRVGGVAAHVATAQPPYVAGLEFAGTIDAVGPETGWEPGVAVMGMTSFIPHGRGAHAEQVVVDARSVVEVPEGASMADAATVPMNGLTARLALDRLSLAHGQTLAVTGAAGAVGGYVIQLASSEGIRVIAISSRDDEDLVRGFGADEFVARGEDFASAVRELTGGGVDALVDAAVIGDEVLPAVRDRGRIVCLRAFAGEPDRDISTELISVRQYATEPERLRSLARLVEQGALDLRVAETFAPDRAAEAHTRLEASGIRGRLVLAF
jgi:NADPH:quinone reductase-like Zn-dependent oxidoreductase